MAGIFPDTVRELYDLPSGYEAVAAIAIGYPGNPAVLPERFRQREMTKRSRKPIADFTFSGHWGHPSPIVKG